MGLKHIDIFTDGACSGNPGPGGYAAILRYNGIEKTICGHDSNTTNNRMELTAVIKALTMLNQKCEVTIYSDSKYIIDSIENGWALSWKNNGWKKKDKKPALNSDLWDQLLNLLNQHDVEFVWIKGHDGHPENERCDQIAVDESKKAVEG